MSRIRSIKPEFWTSAQVLECSTNARLLFIGLWNFCDDAGRHPYSAKQIKAEIFPADDFSPEYILGWLDELSKNDLITIYEANGTKYFYVNGWHHQRIDKPRPSKYPGPVADHSSNGRGTLPPDTIGYDKKGKDKKEEPYAFSGKVIRLNQKNLDLWVKNFPSVNVIAELTARDPWLASSATEEERKRWFISTAKYLANKEAEAKRKSATSGEPIRHSPADPYAGRI